MGYTALRLVQKTSAMEISEDWNEFSKLIGTMWRFYMIFVCCLNETWQTKEGAIEVVRVEGGGEGSDQDGETLSSLGQDQSLEFCGQIRKENEN